MYATLRAYLLLFCFLSIMYMLVKGCEMLTRPVAVSIRPQVRVPVSHMLLLVLF